MREVGVGTVVVLLVAAAVAALMLVVVLVEAAFELMDDLSDWLRRRRT